MEVETEDHEHYCINRGKIPESYNPEFVGVIDDAFGVYSIEMKK